MLTAAVAGCQQGLTPQVASSDTVDRTYKRNAGSSSDGASHFEVAAKVKEHQGKVMLCVAVTGYGSSRFADEWPPAVAEVVIISAGDERIATGAPFAAIYTDERTTLGKTAQCALTSKPWRAEYISLPIRYRLPPLTLRA